ncbi:MAG TPA: valine--tRNA ligase [Actinomycetota bacterium]|jgi:valyl-tRNA synthetase|nr:valine--tRNA ligase [Actinomycetota bacterium]
MAERSFDTTIPKAYDAKSVESRWYAEWVDRGYFRADPTRVSKDRPPFCIVLPPPNVTGALHIGHALQQTLQDVPIRRRRMQGYETLWLPGTDHAGIATQVVVERHLRSQGVEDPRSLGREAFVDRVWEWKEQYGNRIVEQMQALGNSCDWSRLRFTMDEQLSRAVRVAFVRMYEDDLIYRGERIVNWCPTDQTALSDSELEHDEVEGELVTFRYPLSDGSGHIDVATTRVETMLGDTGVAVHPDDERYRHLVGKTVRHPFSGQDLPIVADSAVDPGFGTGAVKVTPAHDATDFETAERTGLPRLNILNGDGTISDAAPGGFAGLDRYEARRRVYQVLRERGLIVKEERPYVHSVGRCYRCHSEIEPWLSGKQWFVAVSRLAGPAKEAAESGRVRFFPLRWVGPYTAWLDNLRDWNISRQLWWGHRIPVWYCEDGHEFAAVEDPDTCPECGSGRIEQDPDVLDTWFSSQLWPFSTLGWPDETDDLRAFYPTSVLVTGYEILYLWVARMIMSGLYLVSPGSTRTGDPIPYEHVVIHGLVRDEKNRKMSKSLGNVIDPLEVIERFGADALRFAVVRLASPEQQNYPMGLRDADAGRNFANKIWNAARLVFEAAPEVGVREIRAPKSASLLQSWLLSRHEACRAEVDQAMEEYRFDAAAIALHRFLWSEYCDWGLEMAKPALYEGTDDRRTSTWGVLAWVLERTLRLLHPIMPFVTEEIWQRFEAGESIVVAPWPEPHWEHRDEDAERRVSFVEEVVSSLRRFRSDHDVSPSRSISARVIVEGDRREALESLAGEVRRLARLDALDITDETLDSRGSARLVVQGAEVLVPLAGVLDPAVECERIRRRLLDLDGDTVRAEQKLANEGFLAKAPAEVVEAERRKLEGLKEERAGLDAQLVELGCADDAAGSPGER